MSQTDLYRRHLEQLDRHLTASLTVARQGGVAVDAVLFHSGRAKTYHRDDRVVTFRPTPHFFRWVPVEGPEHLVLATPGRKPRVVRVRPRDYWYDTSPPEPSYWEEAVDFSEATSFAEALEQLGPIAKVAYVGDSAAAARAAGIDPERVEPEVLIAPLDWYRAYKTEHEVAQLRCAAEKAASGHQGAHEVFAAGGSEREIHWAFLESSDQMEHEVPYDTIVALESKGAILHYQHKRGPEAGPGKVLLIDAGASHAGYAADITRTWATPDADPVFAGLISGMDVLERELVAMVTPGRQYLEIHLEAHRGVAKLLAECGVFKVAAEEAYEKGLAGPFMPHGVGHQLGLQVHDVGGHQAGPDGGEVPPPEAHPYLRNTRLLEPGHVVTIEPGLYFIPMLLEPWRQGPDAGLIDWDLVHRLSPLGGIRIEDNILCTEAEPMDFTRPLLAGPRGE